MSAKFTAFENEASTSQQAHYYASAGAVDDYDYDEGHNERIEMNVNQYPNYQSHQPHQVNQGDVSAFGASPYGAVDEDVDENDLTDDLQEKEQKNVGYRKFIHNNSEQFKPIVGGLVLLLGSGIHIVWGIYRVLNLYEKREATEMHSMASRCIIWSWYTGAIAGSIGAAFALQRIRKNLIYFAAAAVLILSGILLFISHGETDYSLFFARLCGGCTHGLVYVTILVHASENATKEFREFLVLIIGAVLNYSLLISVLCFFYTDDTFTSHYSNCFALIAYGICSMIIVAKHSTETVPFLLQNNGTEMDGLETMAKLKKKPIAARSVHHDYLTMRKVVNDELVYYGPPTFGSVFLVENRKSLIFCLFGRLCSILSFNLPLIVMILLFLRNWIDESVPTAALHHHHHHLNKTMSIELTTLPPATLDHLTAGVNEEKNDETNADAVYKNAYHHSKPKRERRESNADTKSAHQRQLEVDRGKEQKPATESANTKDETGKIEQKSEAKPSPEKDVESKHKEEHKAEEKVAKADEHDQKDKSEEKKLKEKTKDEKNMAQHTIDVEKEKSKEKEAEKLKEKEKEKAHDEEKVKAKVKEREEEKNKEKHKQNESPTSQKEIVNAAKDHNDNQMTSGEHVIEYTTYTHLLIFLHQRELTLVLIAWFIFGTLTVAFLYTLNMKRFIYHVACILCAILVISGIAHSFHFMSGIMHLSLIIYFNYITIPIDLFGHGMLAEAFPITLKAYSIAVVTSIEHFIHIVIIGLYMTEWFHDSIVIFMLAVAYLSHEVAINLPQKSNLSLTEARDEYQKVNLLFIGHPASVNDRERI